MPRRIEEDEDMEYPKAIIDLCSEDDEEEANEDLSLKILEKALSRRAFNDSKEKSMSDLNGSGVVGTVIVNGGKSKANKKIKRSKLEDSHEIAFIDSKDEDDEIEKSAEPKPGEASSNMVLKKLLRGARYFDPPDAGWVTCYSCGEQGHITVNCPTPTTRRKPCFICGSLEHGARQCSKGHDCYICKKGGHRAKDCPEKYKSGSKSALCLRCGDFGHDMMLCKYEYSQDDLKDIQCYVCKSIGHLCCVEADKSPLWAVSCYRCGQSGHTGLACGRHYYDEDTEKDSAISCFKCGGEGHLKRDCPNSLSSRFPDNNREVAICFNCGEEGHFSRECPNFSNISSVSQGRDSLSVCYRCNGAGHFARECPNSSSLTASQGRDSPSMCYRCNGAGHFARECPNSSQVSKKNHDTSTTPSRRSSKKNKENSEKSSGKTKKKTDRETKSQTTSQKRKHRGGWIPEDLEEESFQRGKTRTPRSPVKQSGHNYRSPATPMGRNSGGHFPGSSSTSPYGQNHRYSSSESRKHLSGNRHSKWQPYSPPSHHQKQNRYAPEPSKYGPGHRYGEFAGNYDRVDRW